ncbi:Ig-like domain-containing protein [Paenibacillus sp. Leaf72]|uniref:Ig-like domain-containing protein n=1 Tax=Paenibacillus sp. Leaf72 TaxID=1736234 RepID=UPI0012DFDA97|nr:Ig-like domain-containing protein [Paenibacillus sp. Leaf72]
MNKRRNNDKIRKTVHLLLAVMLLMPLLASGGTAWAAAGWSPVDGGGTNGLNVNPVRDGNYTALAVFNNEVYEAWQETNGTASQIRVKKYNGTSWTSVDGNGANGVNVDPSKAAITSAMAVFEDELYVAWVERNSVSTINQIKVKKYNGASWTSVDGDSNGLNINASRGASYPSLFVHDNNLYAAWNEVNDNNANQIRVKRYDGTAWTSADGGGVNGLNANTSLGAAVPKMAEYNGSLYLAWQETNGSAVQIRAKKYDGTNWTSIDGGGTTGLNVNGAKTGANHSLAVFNNALYLAWDEIVGTNDNQIRVKKYDGSTWTSVDGNGTYGINKQTDYRANYVVLTALDNALYAAWSEYNGTAFQIRVKKYDGTSWTSVDGNGVNGLNVNVSRAAQYPAAAALNNVLYVGWQETNGSVVQIRTSSYMPPVPPTINSVTVSPSTASVVQGGSRQLTATVDAAGGAATTVTWTSSDSSKVMVNSTGNVTVAADAAPGDYTITATSTVDSSKKGTSTITVTVAPAINNVSVSPSTASVVQGGSRQLTAAVDAVGGAATTVTWTSSDASKVTVNSTGNVTVAANAAPGDYTITATSTVNSSKKGTSTITVTAAPAVNSVSVSPSTASVVQGESKQLTASVDAVGGAAMTVTWTSNDSSNKVEVDSTGNVTVAADAVPGDYTITATSTVDGSKKGTSTITVTAAPAINSVSVSPNSASVERGGSKQLTASVDAVGGAATTVTWISDDVNNKVEVDSTGNVTVAPDAALGDYTITATSTEDSSKKGTATITVTVAQAINSVTVSPSTASVVQGGSEQLTATVDAVGGAATTVTWISDDVNNKVSVDSTGNVTVAQDATPGDYTITATSTIDNSKTGTSTITVTAAASYSIAAITDQTLAALVQGYESGTQETKTIPVMNTGTGDLLNLSTALSGANADDFVVTQPDSTLTSSASTSFDIHAKDGLPAGTYTATVTVTADHMTPVIFNVTQVVNLPNAPENPQNLVAVGGDRQVTLNWGAVSDAVQYRVYMATDPNPNNLVEVAIVTSPTYSAQNLVNGTTYYFVVKSENVGGLSGASNQTSATSSTIPGVPANVSAVAGNGQAVVTFTAPADNGGSAITGYEVTASPGNISVIGGASPITLTGLTNGTSYTFTVKAINDAGRSAASAESNTVIPTASNTPSQPSAPSTSGNTNTANNGVNILVNGKVENAGTATVTKRNNQTEITVIVDQKKLDERLAAEGQHAIVTIPIDQKSDIFVGELNGQMVKNMEDKQAVLVFKTENATYTLPAGQINIDAISKQVGELIALQDIKVQIEIAIPTTDTLKLVENAAAKGQFTLVGQPLSFTVRAAYGDKIFEVTNFDAYVERTIAIPDGVDPGKITTGVVVEPDGSVRHVPTKIRNMNGKYEAQINSLTNSEYAVVWHPLEFSDMINHWAKNAVNDMGSRMVVDGTGNGMFSPDLEITRAEFAAIIVRGLGLKLENGATPFSDVLSSDWYSSAVNTAYSYRLISGFEDGTFRPNDKITREQAMVILSKAMAITGLKDTLLEQSADNALRPFEDAAKVAAWAQSSVADNVQAGLVFGRNGALLAPKGNMTRAEVATIIQRLLQKSDLI